MTNNPDKPSSIGTRADKSVKNAPAMPARHNETRSAWRMVDVMRSTGALVCDEMRCPLVCSQRKAELVAKVSERLLEGIEIVMPIRRSGRIL